MSIQPLAFFDFDDTVIEGDSILYWLRYYYNRRPSRRPFQLVNVLALALRGLKLIDNELMKRIFLTPMAYEKPERVEALAKDFVEKVMPAYFYREVLQRMWTHYHLGHQVVLISASAEFYLRYLVPALPPCRILGTEMRFPGQGMWRLAEYVKGNMKRQRKVEAILEQEDWRGARPYTFAYSDHHSDLPLLEHARYRFCVHPTPRMARHAEELGWTRMLPPRRHSGVRIYFMRALILLFAAGRGRRGATLDQLTGWMEKQKPEASHVRALWEEVLRETPEAERPQALRLMFPREALDKVDWDGWRPEVG